MGLIRVKVWANKKIGNTLEKWERDHLLNPDHLVCVVLGEDDDEKPCLWLYLSVQVRGETNITISDPPSMDRILDLERMD